MIISRNPSLNKTAMTVMAWVKTTQADGRSIISEYSSGDPGFILSIGSGASGVPDFYMGSNWTNANVTSVRDNSWHLIAATYDGSNAKVYVDGILDKSAALGSPDLSTVNALYIGNNAAAGVSGLLGTLDEIKLVKRAMSDDEIWAEYNGTRFKYSTDGGANYISSNTWSSLTSVSTSPPNYNNLVIPAQAGIQWSPVVLISSQTPFFQEHATNNKLKLYVMDSIGNLSAKELTVNIAAAAPSVSNDRVSNADGTDLSGIASNWTNTFSPILKFDVQDQGSGLSKGSPSPIGGSDPNYNKLLLYLPFDEGTGTTTVDLSSNGANGITSAAPTWTSGKFGNALLFPQNYSVDIPTITGANNLSAITVQTWIKLTQASSCGLIIRKGGYQAGQGFLFGAWDAFNNESYFRFMSNSGVVQTKFLIKSQRWYHLTATHDGTTGKIYVDGALAGSNSWTPTLNTVDVFRVSSGDNQQCSNPLDGSLDEVKIYNYARTQDEIQSDYRRGVGRAHEVAISTDSGANYFKIQSSSISISGADGSSGVELLTADSPPSVCPLGWSTAPVNSSFAGS
ncbi:MAG: LamG domain-containing protein, partial [Elusimicrobiota bacterium]